VERTFQPRRDAYRSAWPTKTARVWDPQSGNALVTWPVMKDRFERTFQPGWNPYRDGGPGDKTVRIWVAGTGELLKTLVGHKGQVHSAQFSPNGDCIVSTSWDTARVWDASTGRHWRRWPAMNA